MLCLRVIHVRSLLIRSLARLTEHKLAELFALNLSVNLIGERTYMLRKHRLLSQLLRVVELNILQLCGIRHLGLVYDRLHIVLQLLHDILVLQLRYVLLFALYVGIE